MHQNDQTCTLKVNSARIGMKVSTPVVLTYNTMIFYTELKSTYFNHCWDTWHHSTSSLLPSVFSAGPMFKWRGYSMRIRNRNKTSGWKTLPF